MKQMLTNYKIVIFMLAGLIFTGSAVAEPDFYKVRPDSVRAGATLILRNNQKFVTQKDWAAFLITRIVFVIWAVTAGGLSVF